MPLPESKNTSLRRAATAAKADGAEPSPKVRPYKPVNADGRRLAERMSEARYQSASDDRAERNPVPTAIDVADRARRYASWLADQPPHIQEREESRRRQRSGTNAALRAALLGCKLGVPKKTAAEMAEHARDCARLEALTRPATEGPKPAASTQMSPYVRVRTKRA